MWDHICIRIHEFNRYLDWRISNQSSEILWHSLNFDSLRQRFFQSQLTSGWRNIVFKQHRLASVNFLLLDRNKQFRITGTTPQSIRAFKWVSIPLATEPKVWATAICNSNEESGFPIKWINLGKIPFSTIECFWRLLPIRDPFNWLKKWMSMLDLNPK